MQLITEIQGLNDDNTVHGILVQLPLPAHLDEKTITDAVDYRKDVDGCVFFDFVGS
jgi:methylenetetrahydrofolate dehydrogenase (NADP+)/methenyltetrahydrofolate cyclohydrolase/formyltetrahydrofolate synthetase